MDKLVELGKELGYTDEDLKNFVSETLNRERDERQSARELEKTRIEADKAKMEAEKENKQIDFQLAQERIKQETEIKLKELEIEQLKLSQGNVKEESSPGAVNENLKLSLSKKIPCFDETKDDIHVYLQRFEQVCRKVKLPDDEMSYELGNLLKGQALNVYSRMQVGSDPVNYPELKKELLLKFQANAKGFREKFRTCRPEKGDTAIQFSRRLSSYFDRWLELSKINSTFDALRDIILQEQFLLTCSYELRVFIERMSKDNSFKTCVDLAQNFVDAGDGTMDHRDRDNVETDGENDGTSAQKKRNHSPNRPLSTSGKRVTCFRCGKQGHRFLDCRVKLGNSPPHNASVGIVPVNEVDNGNHSQQPQKPQPQPSQVASLCVAQVLLNEGESLEGETIILPSGEHLPIISTSSDDDSIQCLSGKSLSVVSGIFNNDNLLPPNLPLFPGTVNGHHVSVLRDSGCSGVVVGRKYVKPNQFTGKKVACILVDGSLRKFPVCKVRINSPIFAGVTEAMCVDNPVCGLVIGNIKGLIGSDRKGSQILSYKDRLPQTKTRLPQTKTKVHEYHEHSRIIRESPGRANRCRSWRSCRNGCKCEP